MIIIRWILSTLAVLIVDAVLPGISIASVWTAVIFALVLGLLNAILRPILIVLTLPITILTLGLFTLIINAGLFLLAGRIVSGISIDTFGTAFVGSLLLWLLGWATNGITRK